MANVLEELQLPNSPALGTVTYLPLGGDGFTAPFAAWSVANFETAHTATGRVEQAILMDPRYCSLIAWCTTSVAQAITADQDVRITIPSPTSRVYPEQNFQGNVESVVSVLGGRDVEVQWQPTPFILPGGLRSTTSADVPRITARWPNVVNDSSFMDLLVYLFDIRVREVTPMGPLLWARGST